MLPWLGYPDSPGQPIQFTPESLRSTMLAIGRNLIPRGIADLEYAALCGALLCGIS